MNRVTSITISVSLVFDFLVQKLYNFFLPCTLIVFSYFKLWCVLFLAVCLLVDVMCLCLSVLLVRLVNTTHSRLAVTLNLRLIENVEVSHDAHKDFSRESPCWCNRLVNDNDDDYD